MVLLQRPKVKKIQIQTPSEEVNKKERKSAKQLDSRTWEPNWALEHPIMWGWYMSRAPLCTNQRSE